MSKKINIVCVKCRERVGYVIKGEVGYPLKGEMIHPHPGCENWPLPGHYAEPKEFTCPHAVGGDEHIFVPYLEGEEVTQLMNDASLLIDLDRLDSSLPDCPCGCGGKVKEGNKYFDGLECYRRHTKKEIWGIEDDRQS